MRLFTGLALTQEITDAVSALMQIPFPTANLHWSPPENLHITTKFLGEMADVRLP